MQKIHLSQVMTRGIETQRPEASLGELVHQMRDQRLSCVVVVRDRKPIGIVSERDCVRVLDQMLAGTDVAALTVAEVMTSPVISVSSDLTWIDALDMVRRHRIRRLPVVDDGGLLVGLVTQSDLLQAQKLAMRLYREELEVAIGDRTRELVKARDDAETALHGNMEFLATMTHEIRTPLGGVISVAELLRDTQMTRQQADWVKTITSSGRALATLVDDILDFAKMEASQVEVEQVPFGLLEMLEEVADLLALKAQSKSVELRLVYDPLAPMDIVSDPARLRQLITNLCGNAVKFTEQGEVSVHVGFGQRDGEAGRLRIEVRDTGIGIPVDRQAKLFQAYSQADASITRRFGGTGLGLAISRKLVEAMGGEIGLTSTPDVGSTFWFELEVGIPEPTAAAPGSCEGTVAIIDGHRSTATDLRRLLAASGVEGRIFGTPREALDSVEAGSQVDAAFVRFPLPDRKHKQGLDRFRELLNASGAPVFLITDIADHALAAGMAHHGYSGALTRPIKRRPLHDALSNVFNVPELTRVRTRGVRVQNRLARENFRLLLAEDNKVNQLVIQQQLRRLGFDCTIVGDGEQAVRAFRERAWDLVLLDYRMPLMDGPDAAREIRRIEAERATEPIKIVALTASTGLSERDRCLDAGMNGFLSKPIQLDDLEAALDAYLNVSCVRTLTLMQYDALAELMNIGVGRAAAELSDMLGRPVGLSVPAIETVGESELASMASGFEHGDWSCVQLGFDGGYRGSAALLFSDRGTQSLVDALLSPSDEGPEVENMGEDIVREVGNVVLSALVGCFANTMGEALDLEVPGYSRGSVARMMVSDLYFGAHTLLMARTHFVVKELAVEGVVLLVLGLSTFDRLLHAIEDELVGALPATA